MWQIFGLVTAAVTPVSVVNDAPVLQTIIGFLILLILSVIGFFVGRLYKAQDTIFQKHDELMKLVVELCSDFAKLRGEHDAIMRKGHE